MLEEPQAGDVASVGGVGQHLPIAVQRPPHRLRVEACADSGGRLGRPVRRGHPWPVPCNTRQICSGTAEVWPASLRRCVPTRRWNVEASSCSGSGAAFGRLVDERTLEPDRFLEAARRCSRHAAVDEGGRRRVVAGNAEPFQVVQRPADLLRIHSRRTHQLVGGDALVRVRIDRFLREGIQPVGGSGCRGLAGRHVTGLGQRAHPAAPRGRPALAHNRLVALRSSAGAAPAAAGRRGGGVGSPASRARVSGAPASVPGTAAPVAGATGADRPSSPGNPGADR